MMETRGVLTESSAMSESDTVEMTFRALAQSAERKYARVRDFPVRGRGLSHNTFKKAFKAYMRLWKYQQKFRAKLVDAGLNRWEIGEIASRIGQLYFGQYMRTSEARFLVEAYVFYEAILNRNYFDGAKGSAKDLVVRSKELRFYARFLLVSLILTRMEMVKILAERFKSLVDDSKGIFETTDHKEWRLVVQEIDRFIKADTAFMNVRPLRFCAVHDSHQASLPFVARFHAKRFLKFQDAVLASYHRNEVKFAEITLDTYRMLQCLEWEPSGSFYQSHPVEPNENGPSIDHSGTSAVIDINLAADMNDPCSSPNPKKTILYRPYVTHLISVMATICDELSPDSVMLIYLAAAGKGSINCNAQVESSVGPIKLSKNKIVNQNYEELCKSVTHSCTRSVDLYDDYLCFGPRGNGGSNILYPGDLVPFTRKPLFLIIDSNQSHAFKVLHGMERGETAALLLSHLKPAFHEISNSGVTQTGSQFTFFLTSPLPAFCEMVGLSSVGQDIDIYEDAETILSNTFSEWEVILCTSTILNLVWGQVLSDHLLRRLILRFIFCRAALFLFAYPEDKDQYQPLCLPSLPDSVSPNSNVVKSAVVRLAQLFKVSDLFHFNVS